MSNVQSTTNNLQDTVLPPQTFTMFECEQCTACFWHQQEYEHHLTVSGHWPECETCDRVFLTERACNQHMNACGHWAQKFPCETCGKIFHTQNAANQHMNKSDHWAPQFPCSTCKKRFHTQQAAEQHMKTEGHYQHYCKSCDRQFHNENNLHMHLNSKTHRGRTIDCPFCDTTFVTVSGLSHHLETGSCPLASSFNRETIFRAIRERDQDGVITNNLLEFPTRVRYSATQKAFNGSHWECYICHSKFTTVTSLNSHLNSPVHQQNLYHCPNSKQKCGKRFVSLAALCNHLESESCAFMRFEKVQMQVTNVIQGRNRLTFG